MMKKYAQGQKHPDHQLSRQAIFDQWKLQFALEQYPGKDEADVHLASKDYEERGVEGAIAYWQEFCDGILVQTP